MTRRPTLRTAYLAVTLFVLLAGDAVRYTIGWIGYGVLAGLLVAGTVALLIASRRQWRFDHVPYPLTAFLVLTVVSTAWSFYPAYTALGAATTIATAAVGVAIAIVYSWADFVRVLGLVLRWLLGLSLLFELFVAVILRRPILPLVPQPGIDYSDLPDRIPPMLYWSREELFAVFDGGRIQGIVGNAVLLGFLALLAAIVFAVQWADGTVKARWAAFWLIVAGLVLVLTSSATITVALVACAAVAGIVVLLRRARTRRGRGIVLGGVGVAVAASILAVVLLRAPLLAALGKSDDLTGRLGIWETVIGLAQQRPALGWGWLSYWVPWIEPFENLVFRNGVRQLHAHNAWIDVWFQLGVVGLVVFGALVLSTLVRAGSLALDRSHPELGAGRFTAMSMLPLLLLTALLVQSLAESRLLVEGGMMLLAFLATKTKARDRVEAAP